MARTRSLLTILGITATVVSGFIFFTSSSTEAGFEWVPAQSSSELPAIEDKAPDTDNAHAISVEPLIPTLSPLTPNDMSQPLGGLVDATHPSLRPHNTKSAIKVIRPNEGETENPRLEMDMASQDSKENLKNPAPVLIYMDEKNKNSDVATTSPTAEPNIEHASSAPQFSVITGFGSNMPLAFALSQIVPDGYAYALGENVNAAALVSWNGGATWTSVIKEMIKPLDLSVTLRGSTVLIYDPVAAIGSMRNGIDQEQHSNVQNSSHPINAKESRRENITVPTQIKSAQPDDTMEKIGKIAHKKQVTQSPPQSNVFENSTKANSYQNVTFWEGKKGESAKNVLGKWTKIADVDLVWGAPHDFALTNNILVHDNFENALMMLLSHAIDDQERPSMTLLETPNDQSSAKVIIR